VKHFCVTFRDPSWIGFLRYHVDNRQTERQTDRETDRQTSLNYLTFDLTNIITSAAAASEYSLSVYQNCSRRSRDIMVTISVRTNESVGRTPRKHNTFADTESITENKKDRDSAKHTTKVPHTKNLRTEIALPLAISEYSVWFQLLVQALYVRKARQKHQNGTIAVSKFLCTVNQM